MKQNLRNQGNYNLAVIISSDSRPPVLASFILRWFIVYDICPIRKIRKIY